MAFFISSDIGLLVSESFSFSFAFLLSSFLSTFSYIFYLLLYYNDHYIFEPIFCDTHFLELI